jgi:hypothetical protein
MAYVRKTVDCWRFLCNYGYGWEEENIEFTRGEMLENKKAYEENSPGALRIVKSRMKISDLVPGQLEEIEAKKKQQSEARHAKLMAKLKANAEAAISPNASV